MHLMEDLVELENKVWLKQAPQWFADCFYRPTPLFAISQPYECLTFSCLCQSWHDRKNCGESWMFICLLNLFWVYWYGSHFLHLIWVTFDWCFKGKSLLKIWLGWVFLLSKYRRTFKEADVHFERLKTTYWNTNESVACRIFYRMFNRPCINILIW